MLLLILGAGLVSVLYISSFRPQITGHPGGVVNHAQAPHDIGSATLTGPAIAPKLGNETAKYVPGGQTFAGARQSHEKESLLIIGCTQGRARECRVETPAHDLCALPRQSDSG